MNEQKRRTLREYLDDYDMRIADLKLVENLMVDDGRTETYALDEPGAGGACHHYIVIERQTNTVIGEFHFQNGPIQENGINGIQGEHILAIQRHRLQGFQSGDFSCRENALSLTKLEESTMWLNVRTLDRINRDVEGKSEH